MNEKLVIDTKNYVDKLKKTQPYIDYLNYKSVIDRQPEIKTQVDEFRRKSFEVQIGHKYGYFNAYENLLKLKEENEELLNEPLVKSFLEAELKVSKMISEVLTAISEDINFDIDFLNN